MSNNVNCKSFSSWKMFISWFLLSSEGHSRNSSTSFHHSCHPCLAIGLFLFALFLLVSFHFWSLVLLSFLPYCFDGFQWLLSLLVGGFFGCQYFLSKVPGRPAGMFGFQSCRTRNSQNGEKPRRFPKEVFKLVPFLAEIRKSYSYLVRGSVK